MLMRMKTSIDIEMLTLMSMLYVDVDVDVDGDDNDNNGDGENEVCEEDDDQYDRGENMDEGSPLLFLRSVNKVFFNLMKT